MAGEQSFRSPGFFDREIDLSQQQQEALGVPYGIVGRSLRGPAFVPVTVGSYDEFKERFGPVNDKMPATQAAREVLRNKSAVTFVRVLGAGANVTTTHINTTLNQGRVYDAGFAVTGTEDSDPLVHTHKGTVQFIAANHTPIAEEAFGFPVYTNNDSYPGTTSNLIRAIVMCASGTRIQVLDGTGESYARTVDSFAQPTSARLFKLCISSSDGTAFANDDGNAGIRIMTASLDPNSAHYIGRIMNKDPEKFPTSQHLLYADFAVEDELTPITVATSSIAVLSGSASSSTDSGNTSMTFMNAFGQYDARYRAAATPWLISQPFGDKEYDLFKLEAIDDGAYANTRFKVSVSNIRASIDDSNPYGKFNVQVRAYDDTDLDTRVLEQFTDCTLDPLSDRYVAKAIGDVKLFFNFDADQLDERRLMKTGKYPNRSRIVRVIMNTDADEAKTPKKCLPFGFKGVETLKTSFEVVDTTVGTSVTFKGDRLKGKITGDSALTGSIVPPLPFRFKVTRGASATTGQVGAAGANEVVDSRYYWGVKFERCPTTSSLTNAALNVNVSDAANLLIEAYTRFVGPTQLDLLHTGTFANVFNNNKFSLSRVALKDQVLTLSGSVSEYMREAAYVRNGVNSPANFYRINDGTITDRVTFATILNEMSASEFNRFADYMKFSTIMYGGFDGVNVLDTDAARMNDRATSTDTWGGANTSFVSPGLATAMGGFGETNNAVFAYRTAAQVLTDPMASNVNVIIIPGIRDSVVANYVMQSVKDYGLAMYVMDVPLYDDTDTRVYEGASTRPDVEKTRLQLDGRALDNNYAAVYFPDVTIRDDINNINVDVPASVAAAAALAFNDRVAYPWFAPAGFNRASLDFVKNTRLRLSSDDRNRLYESRVNPIASFPRQGFVIFGQKTLQRAKSALDRVNVRRLLVEMKRSVMLVARRVVFEQNTAEKRKEFSKEVTSLLSVVRAQSGIDSFSVIIDESNNTQADVDLNIMRGRIVIVPTRAAEFIAIDFIVTNAGVSFE